MAKNRVTTSGIVYSTDPAFKSAEPGESVAKRLPSEQKLEVKLETKHRAGKAVTILEGFIGPESEKEAIGKQLKAFCGTGGSVKDGEILVQGDHRDKIMQWLAKNGFKHVSKK